MERTRIARTSLSELKKRIEVAKERRSKLIGYLQELWDEYQKGLISRDFYVETAHKHFDGKTLKEWVEHYENYIKECEEIIKKNRKDILKSQFRVLIFSSILIIVLLGATLYMRPELTGFFVQEVPEVVAEANATLTTTQQQAILGQPVIWTKIVSLDKPVKTKIRLPIEATNISVNKITYSEENLKEALQKQKSPFQEELPSSSETAGFRITGEVIGGVEEGDSVILKFFRNIGRLTGLAVQEPLQEIEIDDALTEYEIEYQTPAAYAIEEPLTGGKRVKIIGPETIHYQNVLSFTDLPESLNVVTPSSVRIFWRENNTYINPTSVQDKNSNGIYDYIEWIAPELSQQTFDIIVITKAEHLDSEREFISDIYNEVKELDDIWSETIPSQDYVRVVFEIPLTSNRDITIYPRVVNGTPKIEVYEVYENNLIAEFLSLNSNEYNKIFLTNLEAEQDTFDLRVVGGSIEIDHIIDPAPTIEELTVTACSAGGCSVTGLNTYGEDTADMTIAKTGLETVNISASASAPGDTINSVTLFIRHGGDNGIGDYIQNDCTDETTGPGFAFTNGTLICTCPQNSVPNSEPYVNDACTPTGCDWSAAKLDDLRINLCNDDGQSGDNAYIDFINVTVNYTAAVPQWQYPSINESIPIPPTAVSHDVYWTDNDALSFAILEVNGTGASCDTTANVTNTTLSGASSWANLVWPIPSACEGKAIGWKQWANDSANAWNVTDTQVYSVYQYGTLNVSISLPADNSGYSQYDTNLTINATITCGGTGTACGIVEALARYNSTANPDTAINITGGATPFYAMIRSYSRDYLGETIFNPQASDYLSLATVDNDTIVMAYRDVGGSFGKFVVYNIDGTEELGETTFNSEATNYIGITDIDNDSFAVVYRDGSVGSNGTFVVYNINGSVELGETIFNVGSVTPSITAVDNDSVFIAYEDDSNSSNGAFVVYNINGSVELNETSFNWLDAYAVSTVAVDNDSVAIAYRDYGNAVTENGTLKIYNVNGTEELSETVFNLDSTTLTTDITLVDSDSVAIVYEDYPGASGVRNGTFVVMNINGSVELNETIFNPGTTPYSSIATVDSDSVFIVYRDNEEPDKIGNFRIYNINGSVELNETVFHPMETGYPRIVNLDNDSFAISYKNGTGANSYGAFVVYSIDTPPKNPINSSQTLESGQTWNLSWVLNVTSSTSESYLLDVAFNSSYGNSNVPDNNTNNIQINLNPSGVGGDVTAPNISFVSPTPANDTSTENTSIEINVSMFNAGDLGTVKYNWNGTNYTIYNDSLVFMVNFDNVSSLGENDTGVVDLSAYGNNGTVNGGNTTVSGKYGRAMQFDGSDDIVDFGDITEMNTVPQISFSAWFNLESKA
jgi:hypothetical protein